MEIVARIEEEQKLVDANKNLIELFEGKIKEKIGRCGANKWDRKNAQNSWVSAQSVSSLFYLP